tara:strand:- start:332 stop:658 length:327 start_codon:yes stop_codon:yes gene_type:complete
MGQTKLTDRQQQFYERIHSVDSEWGKDSFALACNSIITLGNLFRVQNGAVSILFNNPNFASLKLERDKEIILDEKIHFNEWVDNQNPTRGIAQNIKNMAEQLLAATNN